MPNDGSDLFIITPMHMDDGLVAANSIPLYQWIISKMNDHFSTIYQGAVSLYLWIQITWDHAK